jgi:hypothetical protein
MALKEYIELKPTIRKDVRFKTFLLQMLAVFINNLMPFMCGVYFVQTQSIIFLPPVLFSVFFNIYMRGDDNDA